MLFSTIVRFASAMLEMGMNFVHMNPFMNIEVMTYELSHERLHAYELVNTTIIRLTCSDSLEPVKSYVVMISWQV